MCVLVVLLPPVHRRPRTTHTHTLIHVRSPMSIGGKQLSAGLCALRWVCCMLPVWYFVHVFHSFFFYSAFLLLFRRWLSMVVSFLWLCAMALNFIAKTKEDCEITEKEGTPPAQVTKREWNKCDLRTYNTRPYGEKRTCMKTLGLKEMLKAGIMSVS